MSKSHSNKVFDNFTRISDTAFIRVLLIPKLSPRSTRPRVKSDIVAEDKDCCLTWRPGLVLYWFGLAVGVFRLRGEVGARAEETSMGISNRVRFSSIIVAPVSGLGASWSANPCRTNRLVWFTVPIFSCNKAGGEGYRRSMVNWPL